MPEMSLPFDPLRNHLYAAAELFAEFRADDQDSYARCADIQVLRYFVRHGRNPTPDGRVSTLEALHDNSISEAMLRFLASYKKVAAIMGGHGMTRDGRSYSDIAHLAHAMAKAGYLVVSGGGPGAMEAAHLGAAFAGLSPDHLERAMATLAKQAVLPQEVANLVREDGSIDHAIARRLHAWLAPAFAIVSDLGNAIGPSLGVPSWLYGFEPTTPFATDSAKYFQNSIREDGLVTIGLQGIIYAEGSAGTVQEIFQDTAQNYYGAFSPMVFLSSAAEPGEHYWEKKLPVRGLVEALLKGKTGYPEKVLFTDSIAEVVRFLP